MTSSVTEGPSDSLKAAVMGMHVTQDHMDVDFFLLLSSLHYASHGL